MVDSGFSIHPTRGRGRIAGVSPGDPSAKPATLPAMLLCFLLAVAALVLGFAAFTGQRGLRDRLGQEEACRRALEQRLEFLERTLWGQERQRVSADDADPVLLSHPDTGETVADGALSVGSGFPAAGRDEATAVGTIAPSIEPPLAPPLLARTADGGSRSGGSVAGDEAVRGEAPSDAGSDWERFMGTRMFAWLGGLALFLAVAYFVKYSFDRDLIPPSLRVLIGLGMGAGLVVGGVRLRREAYRVTSQTLVATGVVVLYAALFGGHALYRLSWLGSGTTFVGMCLVTAVAFWLAVRMRAQVVAVLGMLGGFLTPILLSTGQDQPGPLFMYVALLDLGLVGVALVRAWRHLPVSAAGWTVLFQLGWSGRFFGPDRVGLAFLIFVGFLLLFAVAFGVARRRGEVDGWWVAPVGVAAFGVLAQAGWMLGMPGLEGEPLRVFAFVLAADLALLAVAWWAERWSGLHAASGMLAFGYLAVWLARSLEPGLLGAALVLSLVFAALHAGFPVVLRRFRPGNAGSALAQVFPPVALTVLLIPMLKLDVPSFALWPVILLINLMAVALAAWGGGIVGLVVALGLSGLSTSLWITRLPVEVPGLAGTLWIVGGGGVLFATAGAGLLKRAASGEGLVAGGREAALRAQLPVFAGLMPFLLLAQLVGHMPVPEPSALFLVALLMAGMLLGLAWWLRDGLVPWLALGGVALVEHVWWIDERAGIARPWVALAWFVAVSLVFLAYPVVFRKRLDQVAGAWAAAAMAGLPQCHLVHAWVDWFAPTRFPGLIPLAFAVPVGAVFWWLCRTLAADHPDRVRRLAWYGGVTLFLLTIALPVQFERHVLTVGFALEGAALVALFRRVPHPGLRATGVALLWVAFVRLTLNPFAYEGVIRGDLPFLNRWLYTYGVAVAALFLAANRLRPGTDQVAGVHWRPVLMALGTTLLFFLLNLEIADFFAVPGESVRLEFSGHFGREMTCTIAWALFALALVATGLIRALAPVRWAGLGLLGVALAKLFLHDLARLDQLYRIGALAGVAVVAIAASVLYQRFVARERSPL